MCLSYENSPSDSLSAYHRDEHSLNQTSPPKGINRIYGSTRTAKSRCSLPYQLVRNSVSSCIPEQRSVDSNSINFGSPAVHSGVKSTMRMIVNASIHKSKWGCLA
jgi:hypothetical protein